MPVTHPVHASIREKAKALWIRGERPPAISRITGVKRGTIAAWARRGSWEISAPPPKREMAELRVVRAVKVVDGPKPLSDASGAARAALSGVLSTQIRQLERLRFTGASMRNSAGKQGYAAVLKSVVETAEIVYGWRQDDKPGVLFLAGRLPEPPDPVAAAKPVIEVGGNLPPPPEMPLSENVASVTQTEEIPPVSEPDTATGSA